MIFSPDLAAKVLDGSKTQTRRRAKASLHSLYTVERSGSILDPCTYKEGRTYAVQDKRGGTALGRILVLDVSLTKPLDIDEADAYAEGFASAAEFVARWVTMYDKSALDDLCWRIRFELCGSAHVDSSSVDCATSPIQKLSGGGGHG